MVTQILPSSNVRQALGSEDDWRGYAKDMLKWLDIISHDHQNPVLLIPGSTALKIYELLQKYLSGEKKCKNIQEIKDEIIKEFVHGSSDGKLDFYVLNQGPLGSIGIGGLQKLFRILGIDIPDPTAMDECIFNCASFQSSPDNKLMQPLLAELLARGSYGNLDGMKEWGEKFIREHQSIFNNADGYAQMIFMGICGMRGSQPA